MGGATKPPTALDRVLDLSYVPAFLLLAGVALLQGLMPDWPARFDAEALSLSTYRAKGEALIHGVSPFGDASGYMPLASIPAALPAHLPADFARLFTALGVAALPLAAFALGALVHSGACGLLAGLAILFLADLSPHNVTPLARGMFSYQYLHYAALFLAAGAAMAWRAERRGRDADVLAGLAIGATVLFRSPLFLLPLLICLVDWVRERRSGAPSGGSWILAGYLLLLPWVGMNAVVHGRFVPFEHGEADELVVIGAMGEVTGTRENWNRIIDLPHVDEYGEAIFWAMGHVLRHPVRFAWAWTRRVALVLGTHLWLTAGALLGLFLLRGRPEARAAGLMGVYYLCVHCLLAVMPAPDPHFFPLFLLMGVFAIAGVLELLRAAGPAEGRARVAALGTLAALGLAVAGGTAFAAYRCGVFSAIRLARLDPERVLAMASGEGGRDAWPLRERAKLLAARGRRGEGAPYLARALKAEPGDVETALAWGWEMVWRGLPPHRLHILRPEAFPALSAEERQVHLMRAVGHLRGGDESAARRELTRARRPDEEVLAIQSRFEGELAGLHDAETVMTAISSLLPPGFERLPDAPALIRRFLAVAPKDAGLTELLAQADAARRGG